MFHGAIDVDLVEPAHDAVFQTVSQARHFAGFLWHLFLRNGAGLAEAGDTGNIERPRAHSAFVAAAVNLRHQLHPRILAAHLQRARAFRPIQLVPGDGRDVDVHLVDVDRNLADRLHGVGMEDHAAFAAQLADFRDWLQYADFVVGRHDRDQDRLVVHGALQVVEVDQPIFLHRQIGHAKAEFLQMLAGVEHGLVFSNLSDDVVALLAVHFGNTFDGEVVAFGGARGEDDLFRGRADQLGDSLTRQLDRFFRYPSKGVIAAGGVAELLHEVGQHFFENPRIHGRGRVIIHVNGQLDPSGSRVLLFRALLRIMIGGGRLVAIRAHDRLAPTQPLKGQLFLPLTASLKRCPDTNLLYFRTLLTTKSLSTLPAS